MALTKQEQDTVLALVAKEGGLAAFTTEVQAAHATDAKNTTVHALDKAITVTVADWPTIASTVAASTNTVLYSVMDSLKAAMAAPDASQLGPLFVALYGAVKAHLSL